MEIWQVGINSKKKPLHARAHAQGMPAAATLFTARYHKIPQDTTIYHKIPQDTA